MVCSSSCPASAWASMSGMVTSAVHSFTEVFGLGLDLLGGLLIVFFLFEIFPAPGIFAERGLVYRAGIDDYAGSYRGFEIDSAQVRGCGLQGVEQ